MPEEESPRKESPRKEIDKMTDKGGKQEEKALELIKVTQIDTLTEKKDQDGKNLLPLLSKIYDNKFAYI